MKALIQCVAEGKMKESNRNVILTGKSKLVMILFIQQHSLSSSYVSCIIWPAGDTNMKMLYTLLTRSEANWEIANFL